MFSPTIGDSCTTLTPSSCSSAPWPTPEISRSFGRFDGARCDDHLAPDHDLAGLAALRELDAHGLLAVEDDPRGHRPGLDGEVGALHRRMQVGDRGRVAAAVPGGHLEKAAAFLVPVVQVLLVRDAHLHAGLDDRRRDRCSSGKVRHVERAAGAMERVLAALLVLALAEVRQDLVPAPPARAHLRPAVVVGRLPADVEHAVDRRRAAEHLALGPLVLAVARALVDLGLVEPVDLGVVERLAEADRRVDHDVREELARFLERAVVAAASSSTTLCSPLSLSRAASTQPALPAPTMT
jgi:hypothetical protein